MRTLTAASDLDMLGMDDPGDLGQDRFGQRRDRISKWDMTMDCWKLLHLLSRVSPRARRFDAIRGGRDIGPPVHQMSYERSGVAGPSGWGRHAARLFL